MQVVSFVGYTPAARFDGDPWTEVDIEESEDPWADTPAWTLLETQALTPVDADPENPATRNFTTSLANDGELWYRLTFRDGDGDEQAPTLPVQNVVAGPTYATVADLARTLQITPTDAQHDALQRVLSAAAAEINHEINLPEGEALNSDELQLAAQVNVQRAAELWGLEQVPLGLVGLGSDLGPSHLARDSWAKYAFTLASIKKGYGIA